MVAQRFDFEPIIDTSIQTLDEDLRHVPTTWFYRPAQPDIVRATFGKGRETARWAFLREVVYRGLEARTEGVGYAVEPYVFEPDLTLFIKTGWVRLNLIGTHVIEQRFLEADLFIAKGGLQQFLDRTLERVPQDQELAYKEAAQQAPPPYSEN